MPRQRRTHPILRSSHPKYVRESGVEAKIGFKSGCCLGESEELALACVCRHRFTEVCSRSISLVIRSLVLKCL